jgi:hypothetical protein
MAFIRSRFDVGDYDAWKQTFDADPGGRRQSGKGHRIYRSVSNPNDVFVATEFNSIEDAQALSRAATRIWCVGQHPGDH